MCRRGGLTFSFGSETHTKIAPDPGDYAVTVKSDISVRTGAPSKPNSKLVYQWSATTTNTLHVVAQKPDDFKLLDKPELLPAIKSCIAVSYSEPETSLRIELRSPPENIAFDVLFRANGKEYPIGEIALGKGQQMIYFLDDTQLADTVNSGKVDVIFRSSESIARKTVDLFEIWKGEIIFKDVPMLQKK